jgi:hypothetical protein
MSPANLVAKRFPPSITTWTRLEPRPREGSLQRSLQAQVRDPLWMLARQWQVGEFAGDDAGSPVQATLGIESQSITSYRAGLPGGAFVPFDTTIPLETHVEREPALFQLRGSIQLGMYFEGLVRASIASPQPVVDAFRAAFPIAAVDPNPALAGAQGLQMRAFASGRVVDGQALYQSALTQAAGGTPVPPLPLQAADPAVAALIAQFIAFRQSAVSEPSNDPAWQPSQLDFAFALQSASTTTVDLEADAFRGGHLDWYSFSLGAQNASVPTGQAPVPAPAPSYATYNFLPGHVTFRGMPESGWWIFEDGVTDFGQLDAQHVDLAKMLIMEFALIYGTEWFFIPIPTPIGTLQRVDTLVVTDTFGIRTLIRPVEQTPVNENERPWSMFKISGGGNRSDFILEAPTLTLSDDADPLEDVIFLRDNTAAMAWGVEQKLQGALDVAVDGYEQYLVRLALDPPPPPPPHLPTDPDISYVLEQVPPDNWIPLVPIQTPAGALMFRRGTIEIPTTLHGIIPLEPHSQILEAGQPFFLTDRVITQVGLDVQRYLRRARWVDGSTYVWMARQSRPGRGPGWSGLKFDFLRKTNTPS